LHLAQLIQIDPRNPRLDFLSMEFTQLQKIQIFRTNCWFAFVILACSGRQVDLPFARQSVESA